MEEILNKSARKLTQFCSENAGSLKFKKDGALRLLNRIVDVVKKVITSSIKL
jgi:hypothetical protein